jgi:hypothetical protein
MERIHHAASGKPESVKFLREIMVEASALPFQDVRRPIIWKSTNKSRRPIFLDSFELKNDIIDATIFITKSLSHDS